MSYAGLEQAAAALDPVSAEALRRLDALVRDQLTVGAYRDLVIDFVAGEVLAGRLPPAIPPSEVAGAAEALLAELTGELLVEASRRQGNQPHRWPRPGAH
jgi:hypothetical protein